jgi:hypothetical protein
MESDKDLKSMPAVMTKLRIYDDDYSIIIRLKMIEELTLQIRNLVIQGISKTR